ncbi:MAG: hypothetical protein WBW41_04905 [Verrucomicrobiia bacterium]
MSLLTELKYFGFRFYKYVTPTALVNGVEQIVWRRSFSAESHFYFLEKCRGPPNGRAKIFCRAVFPERQQTKLVHRGGFEFKRLLIIQGSETRKLLISLWVLHCSHVVHTRGLVNNLCISIRCGFGDLLYDVRSSLKERSGQWQSTD